MYLCSLIILSEKSQCPVGITCIPGLFIMAFAEEIYQLFLWLNNAASLSTLKFSGLELPRFTISHESKGVSAVVLVSARPRRSQLDPFFCLG